MSSISGPAAFVMNYVIPSVGIVVASLLFLAPMPRVLAVRRRLSEVLRAKSLSAALSAPEPLQTDTIALTPAVAQGGMSLTTAASAQATQAPATEHAECATGERHNNSVVVEASRLDAVSDARCSEGVSVTIPIAAEAPRPLADNRTSADSVGLPPYDSVLGAVNPLPYPLMLGNAIAWISYGFVQSDYFIFWSNGPGAVICSFYVLVVYAALRLDEWRARQTNVTERQRPEPSPPVAALPTSGGWRWWSRPPKESGLLTRRAANGSMAGFPGSSTTETPALDHGLSVDPEQPAVDGIRATGLVRSETTESLLPKLVALIRQRRSWLSGLSIRRTFEGLLFIVAIVLVLSGFFVYIPLASNGVWPDQNARVLVTGLVANIILGFMYSSPLFLIRTVFRTRDASMIDRNFAFMSFVNGALWTAYGFARQEPFIYVLNLLGASLAALQLALIFIYGRKGARWRQSTKQPELEPAYTATPVQVLGVARNEPTVLEPPQPSDGSLALAIAEAPLTSSAKEVST